MGEGGGTGEPVRQDGGLLGGVVREEGVETGVVRLVEGVDAGDCLAALVTWGLHVAGWGKPPGVRPRSEWGMRVRDPWARGGHPGCVGCRLAGRASRVPAVVSVPGPTVVGDGTGMEVRGVAVVGGGAGAEVGRRAS
ncbi:HGxxPAAW family protein [Streptomyces rishiriensis]|uniref:HGxxPAAW family protein n=1 Tax=Streptomyces rishiriensis TaxID=68264 RepID=UPI00359018FB